jgi:DNA helicase II / ATP-dependent DNA helicase PcrA
MSMSVTSDTAARERALEALQGHLQLVACAGAGKTETVARRIVEILKLPDVKPENVAAFTFTEKAAAELKERIASRFAEETGSRDGLADLYVGTIHAFCLGLLQQHDFRVLSYRVLTDVQQRLLISRNSRNCGLADLRTKNGYPWHRYHQAGTFAETMAILREADVDRARLAGSEIEAVLEKYEALLERHRFFDYTSILSRTVELLETDAAFADRVAERLRFVTVDEYQDVNPVQERLLAALAVRGVDVCVVGDDDQLLYDWRGSRMANMIEFVDRYPGVVQLTLEQNFRSSRGIVDLAAHVIERNVERLPKTMRSSGNQRFEEGDIKMRAFDSDDDEAEYIAAEIKELLGSPFIDDPKKLVARGLAFSDCAILVRVKSLIPRIVAALDDADVPYVVGGVASLFDTPEACAARLLFYHLAGEATESELADAWRALDIGIDEKELAAGISYARKTYADKEAGTERFGFYNLQRAFLGFLEHVRLREEEIVGRGEHGHTRGEVIYYNLGKFSQIISDFEQIYFQSNPQEKYRSFAGYLRYQADGIYPEGWLEARYVMPNAVQIMTIHQAKGLQWPVVFVPGLVKGRFPAKGAGGVQPWSVIPDGAVRNKDEYKTTEEDERRLFYVAVTRAQKFLRLTRGVYPTEKRSWHQPSPFWWEASEALDEIDPAEAAPPRLRIEPEPDRQIADVALSFSELKYAFECPYAFKLRFMYGFNPPIAEALGQGKGLHDCLFELHDRALNGGDTTVGCVDELVERHLHLPFAYPELRENLVRSAKQKLKEYIERRGEHFDEIEHAERPVEIDAGNGVRISGRIDLIRRRDTNEVVVIDFKSNDRTQAEEVTDLQLQVYALGYNQGSEQDATAVVVTNLDNLDSDRQLPVSPESLEEARAAVQRVADLLRLNSLPKDPRGDTAEQRRETCERCDLIVLCRDPV